MQEIIQNEQKILDATEAEVQYKRKYGIKEKTPPNFEEEHFIEPSNSARSPSKVQPECQTIDQAVKVLKDIQDQISKIQSNDSQIRDLQNQISVYQAALKDSKPYLQELQTLKTKKAELSSKLSKFKESIEKRKQEVTASNNFLLQTASYFNPYYKPQYYAQLSLALAKIYNYFDVIHYCKVALFLMKRIDVKHGPSMEREIKRVYNDLKKGVHPKADPTSFQRMTSEVVAIAITPELIFSSDKRALDPLAKEMEGLVHPCIADDHELADSFCMTVRGVLKGTELKPDIPSLLDMYHRLRLLDQDGTIEIKRSSEDPEIRKKIQELTIQIADKKSKIQKSQAQLDVLDDEFEQLSKEVSDLESAIQ